MNNKSFGIKNIVAAGIGAALFFVLGRFVSVPCPIPNVTISIQYGLLGFLAVAYGPVTACFAGFVGHFFIDFSYGWGVWYSWVIASAVFGLIVGFGAKKMNLLDGVCSGKDMVTFNVYQAIGHIAAWGVVAPVLDILIYSEPANKVFIQGLVAGVANIVTTAVVGTILCKAFAAAQPKKDSLKEE